MLDNCVIIIDLTNNHTPCLWYWGKFIDSTQFVTAKTDDQFSCPSQAAVQDKLRQWIAWVTLDYWRDIRPHTTGLRICLSWLSGWVAKLVVMHWCGEFSMALTQRNNQDIKMQQGVTIPYPPLPFKPRLWMIWGIVLCDLSNLLQVFHSRIPVAMLSV